MGITPPEHSLGGVFAVMPEDNSSTIGWARFDGGDAASGPVYLLPIFRRHLAEWLDSTPGLGEMAKTSTEPFRWWSLLVQPVPGMVETYQRHGFGEVLLQTWMDKPKLDVVYLV